MEMPAESRGVEPIQVAQFEGEYVRVMEGKLPAITLEMESGYPRGTHLKLQVEVRVRNVRYEEDRRGELTRLHVFALEEVQLLGAYSADELDPGVGGSASAAAARRADALELEVPQFDHLGETDPGF